MDDGDSDIPVYDEEAKTLTVSNGIIIVPDGNHRTISCELANKHLDDCFGVFSHISHHRRRENCLIRNGQQCRFRNDTERR